jgi:hypothetical protein
MTVNKSRFTKLERKELQKLAGLAYERELAKALESLEEKFKQWRKNKITAFGLESIIHKFHNGIAQDKARGLPGPISKWTRHLLDIAEAQKDHPDVKKYALQLFLDSNDFTFYDRYKRCFTAKEWHRKVQKIIDIIRHSKDSRNCTLALPQIYIREKRWLDLMGFVQDSNSSGALENFTKYLTPHFPDELARVYEKVIIEKLAPPMGRGNYQYLCKFLRRLQKLGDKDRARRLVAELSARYSNRPV